MSIFQLMGFSASTCQGEYVKYMIDQKDHAEELCSSSTGKCDGVTVSNIGFGPDSVGIIVISVCSDECAEKVRKVLRNCMVVVSKDENNSQECNVPAMDEELVSV